MIRNLSIILCIVTLYFLLKILIKKNPEDILKSYADKSLGYLGDLSVETHEKNKQLARIAPEKSVMNKKKYKLISDMLFDVGLQGVTVEGFILGSVLISLLVSLVIFFYTKSFALVLISIPSCVFITITLTYILSNSGHFAREMAIMSAEDLIIASLSDGVFHAIKSNLNLFDPLVRKSFERVIENVLRFKIPIEKAIIILTEELGSSSYKFAKKLLEYERTGKQGTLDTFKDDLALNVMRRIEIMEFEARAKSSTKAFTKAILFSFTILIVLCSASVSVKELVVHSMLGYILISVDMLGILWGYLKIQKLRG